MIEEGIDMSTRASVEIQILQVRGKILVFLLLALGVFFGARMALSPKVEEFDLWVRGILWTGSLLVWSSWLYRAYLNLRTVFAYETERSAGMAVILHFIPFVNLFKPYQILCELWVKSAPRERSDSRALLVSWWSVWLLSWMYYIWNVPLSRALPPSFDPLFTFLDITFLPASCLLAARLVWTLTTFQRARHDEASST